MTTTEQDTPGVTISATDLTILAAARAICAMHGEASYADAYGASRTRAYMQVAADALFSAMNVAKSYGGVDVTRAQLHGDS